MVVSQALKQKRKPDFFVKSTIPYALQCVPFPMDNIVAQLINQVLYREFTFSFYVPNGMKMIDL